MQDYEQISSPGSSLPPAQGLYDPAYEKMPAVLVLLSI